jgi:hypothetical protein
MGFHILRVLPTLDLYDMVRSQDTSDISENNLEVFKWADLVMEVEDDDGETYYISVEVNYNVTRKEVRRAVFIAGLLARFTGKRAYPALAGPNLDDSVRSGVEAGEIHWYEIESWR